MAESQGTNPVNVSLVDIGKLSEPLTKLIEVVGKGTGIAYAPVSRVLQAKADAKAKIILANAEAKALSIQERARQRVESQEIKRQTNLESIVAKAAMALPDSVSNDSVDEDWIQQYVSHAQDVSDSDMQIIWARILAGEVANPSSYSKRTLQFLKTLDKEEAEGFTKLCGLTLSFESGWLFILSDDVTEKFVRETFKGSNFREHFCNIGLLAPEPYIMHPSNMNGRHLKYFDQILSCRGPEKPRKGQGLDSIEDIIGGFNNFSQIGQELAKIAGAQPVEGYLQQLASHLDKEFKISLITEQGVPLQ